MNLFMGFFSSGGYVHGETYGTLFASVTQKEIATRE
jgi:hypothetical protein